MDQAAGLRMISNPKPVKVIAVTSGKGGVGKTNVSVNLSVALSRMGHKVMLMDADLGLANVDVQLGIHPEHNLSHVLDGTCTLDEVVVEGPAGVRIVPAASGIKHMAELSPQENAGVIRAFSDLPFDVDTLVVDTAAGISDSVVTFSRASNEIIVVVCDEPASITDAYAMIKVLSRDYGVNRFHVLSNMVSSAREGRQLYAKMAAVTDRFLDISLGYMGHVPRDEHLRKAIQRQKAVVEAYPGSPAGRSFGDLAQRVEKWPLPQSSQGHLEFFVERLVQYSAVSGGMV